MATERDELAEIVYNQASGCDADGNVTKRAALRTADYLIAAGFRRLVPEGSVVVSREDLDTARDAMGYLVDGWQWKKWNYGPAYDRIIAALEDASRE